MSPKPLVKGSFSLINVALRFPDGKNSKHPLPAVPRIGETIIAEGGKHFTVSKVEWSCHEWDKYDAETPHVRLTLEPESDAFIRE